MIVVATNDIVHCQTVSIVWVGLQNSSGGSSDTDFTGVSVIEEGT